MRVLELFCGIGGCAAALPPSAQVVAAIDINRLALEVYTTNFAHPAHALAVESLDRRAIRRFDADLWWLSPPCQPYTRRGHGRDLDDPRARSLRHLLGLLDTERPPALVLENVPPFRDSRARRRVLDVLGRGGYTIAEMVLCPSSFGVPNRRRRYYLAATRDARLTPPALPPRRSHPRPLAEYLDSESAPALRLDPAFRARYPYALDVVDVDDPSAVTACFTAAYGRSLVRSGSYLRTADGIRRFSPTEILRLLSFPRDFRLPPGTTPRRSWRLVGNSLALDPVRRVLATVGSEAVVDDRPGGAEGAHVVGVEGVVEGTRGESIDLVAGDTRSA